MAAKTRAGKVSRKGCALRAAVAVVVLLGIVEIALRVLYGLANPQLYVEDPQTGYRLAPNQYGRRFGHDYTVNAFGERSRHDPTHKEAGVTRVLCVGDSITNGGAPTDDTETYPSQLEKALNASGRGRWDAISASAGGWAPSNELGFLKEFGTSQANVVVLQIAAHDLYQPFATLAQAGTQNYPTTRAPSAIGELVVRYLWPRLMGTMTTDPGVMLDSHTLTQLVENQKTIADEIAFVRQNGARPFVWYVNVEPSMRAAGLSTDVAAYDALTRQLQHLRVPLIDLTREIDASGGDRLFRDGIHPNPEGNKVIAQGIAARLLKGA